MICLIDPSDPCEGLDEPEGRDEEGPLLARQTVLSPVAVDEFINREVLLDRVDRADQAWIVWWEEVDEGDDEECGIEVGRFWGTGKGTELGIVTDVGYPVSDRVGCRARRSGRYPDRVELFGYLDDQVES